jgi:hypothetical protein
VTGARGCLWKSRQAEVKVTSVTARGVYVENSSEGGNPPWSSTGEASGQRHTGENRAWSCTALVVRVGVFLDTSSAVKWPTTPGRGLLIQYQSEEGR